jgi:hypothetical protein
VYNIQIEEKSMFGILGNLTKEVVGVVIEHATKPD